MFFKTSMLACWVVAMMCTEIEFVNVFNNVFDENLAYDRSMLMRWGCYEEDTWPNTETLLIATPVLRAYARVICRLCVAAKISRTPGDWYVGPTWPSSIIYIYVGISRARYDGRLVDNPCLLSDTIILVTTMYAWFIAGMRYLARLWRSRTLTNA